MLFKLQSNYPYWLATYGVYGITGYADWFLFIAAPPGRIVTNYLWRTSVGTTSSPYGVRPVVSLKSNITPTLKSKDDSTGISTYEI